MEKILAPSILAADIMRLGEQIEAVKNAGAKYLHIDVMDGMFVPALSYGMCVVESIRKSCDMVLDVHLMIDKPVRYVEAFAQAGADLLSVHLEADHPTGIAEALRRMEACKVKKAVALRPITAPSAVLPYLEGLDMVLVMSVEPGFSGQSYIEGSEAKVARIAEMARAVGASPLIQVDGGIGEVTAPIVAAAGADVLVCGNAVFAAEDPAAALAAVQAAAEEARLAALAVSKEA